MGIKATDLFMYRAVLVAIEDMRKNEYVMNDVLGDVACDPLLSKIYGEKEIEKFRLFMQKEIHVDVEHNLDMAKLPSIGIRVGGGSEDSSKVGDALGDGYRKQEVDPGTLEGNFQSPQISLGPVTPESYDKTTGKIVMPDNVSLQNIYDEMKVYDEKNKKEYEIKLVLDDKTLFIEAGSTPDLTGMTIRTRSGKVAHTIKSYFFNETVTFICMAAEAAELIYLYSLMMYVLGRYRMTLFEEKNFQAHTVSYGPIYKAVDDPNIAFARDIQVSGRVEHTYIERTDRLIQGIAPGVRIAKMSATPEPFVQQANDQGWKSIKDK